MTMTLQDRVEAFKARFPDVPDAWPYVSPSGRWLYGTWEIGNDYAARICKCVERGTPANCLQCPGCGLPLNSLYGAFPPRFLDRLMGLFPEVGDQVLHTFSGALPPGAYSRLDLHDRCAVPDLRFHQGNVYDARAIFTSRRFQLIVADPPYTATDATRYDTPMVNRRRAIAALAEVAAPGAHLAWLDTTWPMHDKRQWLTVGRLLIQRSTNHRVRVLSIFERVAA